MNTDTLRQIFQSPFNYSEYSRKIVHDLFGCNDVYETLDKAERLSPTSDGDQNYFLGQMEDAEGRLLGFFYTRVAEGSDVRRKRVGLRKLIQPYLRYEVDAAIAVFDDGRHWRLSYICDHKEGTTSAKRFSYVLGDKQGQYKTPLERLDKVAAKAGRFKMDDLRDAFSVDALSKEFFDEYHRHYDRIIAELERQGNTGAVFHDYVKKMMGRIVFLHFLQKKGWLNDDPEFLSKLFFLSPYKQDFLEQELEPLFFGIFNTEPNKREQLFHQEHWDLRWLAEWEKLPYLNGGLFERDEVDKMKIKLPASLFENLFKFMASYNFTIDENDPDDADIGIDPEMLGKIFESLLEDNKAKGAFYTPKEIVRYMCKESLIAYLGTQATGLSKEPGTQATGLSKEPGIQATGLSKEIGEQATGLSDYIRKFVEQHEFPEELEPYREVLDTAMRNVKICDPAIGSGAFPMGLLNELWRCREALGERATSPSQMGTQATGLSQAGSLCSKEGQAGNLYPYSRAALKREIIENNIYGVDIEKGAIDIARLRFWLSIVVDAEKPEPLPNFDYKFMQGNSLIESFGGYDLSHIMDKKVERNGKTYYQRRIGGKETVQVSMDFFSNDTRQNLRIWLKRYFTLTNHHEKTEYRKRINESVKSYIKQQGIGPSAETKLDTLDPSANQDFFLWHTWFKDIFDKGGFDIVIANPPYVNIANIENDEYRQMLKQTFSITRNKTDLYAYFIQRAFSLMNSNGILAYIIPETWKATDSFIKLRELLVFYHTIVRIVNLKMGVFEAIVRPMILLISNLYKKDYQIDVYDNLDRYKYSIDINEIRDSPSLSFDTESSYEDKCLFKKIESVNLRLKDIVKFSRGIKTSDDKRFIHSQAPNNEYKKVFRGKNIKAYSLNWGGEYVWYRPDLMKEKVGCLPHTRDFFEVPEKLVTQRVNSSMQLLVAYDNEQNYFLDTTNVSNYNTINKSFSLKFICGILNSKLINFWYAKKYRMPTISGYELDTIPIPEISLKRQMPIVELVDKILVAKQSNPIINTSQLEKEIDQQVYALYDLTPEEIAIIEQ